MSPCDITGCGQEAKHMLTEGMFWGEYCPDHISAADGARLARIAIGAADGARHAADRQRQLSLRLRQASR